MSKTRDTGFLGNVVKVDNNGDISLMHGSTMLMQISSSGAITTTGVISGSAAANATSASYASNTTLLNGSGSGEFVPTGSFNAFSSSVLTYTGSVNSQLSALQTTSGSNITRISALESASGSAITRLSALEVTSGSNITRLNSLEAKTGSYATTGSNTFDGGQYLSSSFNPTGFSTTASLYTDGGLRVTKDAYISGTLYLNNVTVYGTQSVAYITSSQLNISTNLISVNTDTPSVRFGGLSVYDSGSTGLTGSILWDSENNRWIYSNPSGSGYSGGMFISGPRAASLGSETGTTACMLLAGQGGDHLTSSMIYHSLTATCFYGNSFISSSGDACFGSSITGTSATFSDTVTINKAAAISSLIIKGSSSTTGLWLYLNGLNATLSNQDNGSLAFQTNGTDRLTIANTGAATFSAATQDAIQTVVRMSANNASGQIKGLDFKLTAGTPLWTISTAAVGTDAGINIMPNGSAGLSLAYNGAATFSSSVTAASGVIESGGLNIKGTGATAKPDMLKLSNASAGAYYWDIWRDNTTGYLNFGGATGGSVSTFLTIKDVSGNVGIGTTNPTNKLTILKTITTCPGATGNAALSLGTAGSAGEYNLINFGYDSESWQPAYMGYLTTSGAGSSNGALVFATRCVTTNTQPTERMRITATGNVGINTSNPDVQLQVQSSSCSAIRIRSCSSGGAAPVLNFFHDGNDEFTIRGGIGLTFLGSGVTQKMFIGTNVDISTSATISQKLAIGSSSTPDVVLGVGQWCNRGGRLLTSNCGAWWGDGVTPCAVITSNTSAVCRGNVIGLALHNDGQSQNSWAPTIAFSRRSWSGIYNSTMATITAQAVGCGNDSNWVSGDLVFAVAPTGGYMGEVMRISGNNTQIRGYLCVLDSSGAYITNQLCLSNGSRIHSSPYNQGGYTGDGLWGATATPARIIGTGNESGFLLGYTDNGSGLYGASYGFQVSLKDGLNNCIDYNAIFMRNMGNGNIPFRITSYGNIYGNTKNFLIDHPLPSMNETHHLVHTSIEGPQADLIYRGKVQLVEGKAEVNIDLASRMTDGTFEALCQDVQSYTTNESGWALTKSYVIGNILHIEAQDETATDTVSWLVIGERNDIGIKNSAITDENGHVIVEMLKSEE